MLTKDSVPKGCKWQFWPKISLQFALLWLSDWLLCPKVRSWSYYSIWRPEFGKITYDFCWNQTKEVNHASDPFECFLCFWKKSYTYSLSLALKPENNMDLLWRRLTLELPALRIPVRWTVYIINSVDKTNFLCTFLIWFKFKAYRHLVPFCTKHFN